MNVLLINGHPRNNSLSEAFANAFEEGATAAGVMLKRINLRDICFDPNVNSPVDLQQPTEPAIAHARNLILWAEHIVFVYPVWWGTMPALLKGFIDRVFVSNFAFAETEGGTGYAPLLGGRSAQLIITLDTPYPIYKLIYGAPGNNAMRKALLQFCGFQMAPTLHFGPVRSSTLQQRSQWIMKVKRSGENLKNGSVPMTTRLRGKFIHWLQAIRLQFYPMTFLAYLLGAYLAGLAGHSFDKTVFWVGYLWIFFLEVATVLSNDYFDYSTDKINDYYGPFTGGSRVLVEKKIAPKSIQNAIILFIVLAIGALLFVVFTGRGNSTDISLASFVLFVLALGYTTPPLKLVYRGLGELTVCLTHSFAVIISGYLFIGGRLSDPHPWVLSIPLFLSIFPSIILAGIPDKEADTTVGKKTIAVLFGTRSAVQLAFLCTWLAVISVVCIQYFGEAGVLLNNLLFIVIPHAIIISYFLAGVLPKKPFPHRIDLIMIATLTYIIWFVLAPLFNIK